MESDFHPIVARWFADTYPEPTDAQRQAWPVIARGEHALITAPTGSGKTLTAFLWALNQLFSGAWAPGGVRVLYISPLKALNNDIRRNLLDPMDALRERFEAAGETVPPIRAMTRSGDTPQSDRRRMLRTPPEILITTPESLNILLASGGGRGILGGIHTVILDEIHAVYGTKRGVHLITAIDRLVALAGDFQRLALSATIRPLDAVANFVAGFHLDRTPRPIRTIVAAHTKHYDLRVRYLDPHQNEEDDSDDPTASDDENPASPPSFWDPLVADMRETALRNTSTLFFVNGRALCEKLTFLVNKGRDIPLAYAHHGSLSRDIRAEVERRLKAGELRAIIATSSLELGIDIGALDEVVLVAAPPSVAATTQRLGRAGHQVGATSRGVLYPLAPRDILDAHVLSRAVPAGDLEPARPIDNPLDILAQIIVAMTSADPWHVDDLFDRIRTSHPFRDLPRDLFDRTLHMLAGRYADTRIRELRPRVAIDGLRGIVTARKGARLLIYASGGVIPDRGNYNLRHAKSNARIGELDEEFVWETRIGQVFTLGTQAWQIQRVTHNDVFVTPGKPGAAAPPFWRADENDRDHHFALRIGDFLQTAEANFADETFWSGTGLEPDTLGTLREFLARQRAHTNAPLPHRQHLLVEHVSTGPGGHTAHQTVIHTPWGGQVNRPFAMALEAAWEERFAEELRTVVSDYAIVLIQSQPISAAELLHLVPPGDIESRLRERLERSGIFGARFRHAAGVSLLLPRRKIGERMPLWMTRIRAQKLLDAVKRHDDFPILLEAWRACLQDAFNLPALRERLHEIHDGTTAVTEVQTARPSPFAQGDVWRQVNAFMYEYDEPKGHLRSDLRDDLIAQIVGDPDLRPRIPRAVVADFEARRQRLAPGYAPSDPTELREWVKERVLIPTDEWTALTAQLDFELPANLADCALTQLDQGIIALEREETVRAWLADNHPEIWTEWLAFYGPLTAEEIQQKIGLRSPDDFPLIRGQLTDDAPEEPDQLCDPQNYEILLRLTRKANRPAVEPRPLTHLPAFLARWQGLAEPADTADTDAPSDLTPLRDALEPLIAFPAPAALWESEFLPARLLHPSPAQLDQLLQEGHLQWIGRAPKTITFMFAGERDLLEPHKNDPTDSTDPIDIIPLFKDPAAAYSLPALTANAREQNITGSLHAALWNATWNGQLHTPSLAAIRAALATNFEEKKARQLATDRAASRPRSGRRSRRTAGWSPAPTTGTWRLLPPHPTDDDLDPLDRQERQRDRARILLDRHGILFRELLQRESPEFRWPAIFSALRLMELAGEILSGYFFEDVPGPQFILPRALPVFQQTIPADAIFWINACDPISPCGIGLDPLRPGIPRRVPGNHLVYRGTETVLISERRGKKLSIALPPDHADLPRVLAVIHHLLRSAKTKLTIEEINGEPAHQSEYLPILQQLFSVDPDYKKIHLLPPI